jgi:hypothetical protein
MVALPIRVAPGPGSGLCRAGEGGGGKKSANKAVSWPAKVLHRGVPSTALMKHSAKE